MSDIPDNYTCSNCGKHGIKLWRVYQSFTPHLLCASCAATEEKCDISTMGKDGRFLRDGYPTDQIRWYVPAVPSNNDGAYWGYTSVPDEGVTWWRNLPNDIEKVSL